MKRKVDVDQLYAYGLSREGGMRTAVMCLRSRKVVEGDRGPTGRAEQGDEVAKWGTGLLRKGSPLGGYCGAGQREEYWSRTIASALCMKSMPITCGSTQARGRAVPR